MKIVIAQEFCNEMYLKKKKINQSKIIYVIVLV